jgi:antitoxin component HigA of HigAB toxin-antitoxin module
MSTTATLTLAPRVTVRAIHTHEDLIRAQRRILTLWGSASGTKNGDELDILADLVEAYERRHRPAPEVTGVEALGSLMDGNGLTQSDLADVIGSQGVVSEILSGKRQLNVRQIQALADRFKVPPATFL